MIKINGVNIDKAELSLMQYLEENSISPQRIAVELNEEILPKAITQTPYSKTAMW